MHFSKALNRRNIETQSIKRNIFLIGMMGAGKTTIGKSLANYLDKDFIDSDHEIQLRTGVKIPLIFEIEGEDSVSNFTCLSLFHRMLVFSSRKRG